MRRWPAALAIVLALPAQAQSNRFTAADVVARITQHAAVKLPENTVDTFKAGDPQSKVNGIAVTMMATLDVLKRAAAHGDNFVITHEPTFYGHLDSTAALEQESDPVFAEKQKFIRVQSSRASPQSGEDGVGRRRRSPRRYRRAQALYECG